MSPRDRSMRGMASLWLGLVEQRCLKLDIDSAAPSMGLDERVKLLDAAMRSGDAPGYLDGVRRAFEDGGRRGDAVMAAVLLALIRDGEIETVMGMRAQWRRGGDKALPNPDLAL